MFVDRRYVLYICLFKNQNSKLSIMEKKILLLLLTLMSLSFMYCSGDEKSRGWKLTWEDNFDQNSINESVWSKIPRGRSDWNNYMSDYDSLYDIKDSNLVLRGIQNVVLPNDTAPYLTGGVFTKDKKTFGYGRLEIRAKFHGAKGAWPAFWMLPAHGQWPKGGEIDIMERLSFEDKVYQTVHSSYTHVLGIKDNPKNSSTGVIDPNEYNVYAVEKYPDSLVFFVNGKQTFTYPRIQTDKEGQFPFDEDEFYLLIDMQLGGSWVGAVDPKDLPVQMEIDWVRFYELKQ